MSFLSINPLKPADIPSEDVVISEGTKLIESTASWKTGKTFFGNVKTCSRPKGPGDGAGWYCRISEHTKDEITFDQLWDKLSNNKAENELQFIHEIQKVTQIKVLSPSASIWSLYYTFTPPVSPRVFTVVQIAHLSETTPRTGLIVSISIDLSSDQELQKLEQKAIHGRYVSVERVMELDNGNLEWKMATSGSPGGSIPSFIVESTMAKKVAGDVPAFLKWFHSKNKN
ncbi:hypothetical protein BJ165DRAFT_1523761 [Panaeolus papilionaceus]|nr:hypothetical protein BJ165DRAFT_1523761 [Panaeolus papilionaceus]